MNKKDLIIVATITFCLTASIFMITPTRSATKSYDPWLDYNEDGQISLSDLVTLAQSYGTGGDSTKNVNVTNFPLNGYQNVLAVNGSNYRLSAIGDYNTQSGTLNISTQGWTEPVIYCGGRSRMSVLIRPTNASLGISNNITVALSALEWSSNYYDPNACASWETLSNNVFNTTIQNGGQTWTSLPQYMTEIKAPYCLLLFLPMTVNLPSIWWVTLNYTVYLRNE